MPPQFGLIDKIMHLGAYCVLALLFCFAFQASAFRSERWFLYVSIGMLVILGGLDELTQWPVPGRHADPLDWLADVIGVVLGVSIRRGDFDLSSQHRIAIHVAPRLSTT